MFIPCASVSSESATAQLGRSGQESIFVFRLFACQTDCCRRTAVQRRFAFCRLLLPSGTPTAQQLSSCNPHPHRLPYSAFAGSEGRRRLLLCGPIDPRRHPWAFSDPAIISATLGWHDYQPDDRTQVSSRSIPRTNAHSHAHNVLRSSRSWW